MFPKNHIKLYTGAGTSPKTKFITDETTGIVREITKDCNEKLPDRQMFLLKNQLKAGINLEEVKTNVISNINAETISEEINTIQKKTRKKHKNNEVKHENTEDV